MNQDANGSDKWNPNTTISFVVGCILSNMDLTKGYRGLRWAAENGGNWESLCEVIPENVSA